MYDPDDKREGPRKNIPEQLPEVTAEQAKIYKDCMYSMMFKAGLPYAAVAHVLTFWKSKPEGQQPQATPPPLPGTFVKRAFFFFGNMLVGTIVFAPYCYNLLLEKYNMERKKMEESALAPVTERTPTTRLSDDSRSIGSRSDDYSYPLDLSSSLSNEAETTFTSELSPSRILANEDEVTKIMPSTTYQDLRDKHRSSYMRRPQPPPPEHTKRSPYRTPDENPVESEPSFPKSEPRKYVKRNKYGDEIE